MGNSALGLVLSRQRPVVPKGGQPAYFRSRNSVQTSSKLASFHTCVADKMKNTHGTREDIRKNFGAAAKSCKK